MSKQMAPCDRVRSQGHSVSKTSDFTYGHTRDVWVPDLGDELHDGWLKRVVGWYPDVDKEGSALVRSVGWALEDALEVSEVIECIGSCS